MTSLSALLCDETEVAIDAPPNNAGAALGASSEAAAALALFSLSHAQLPHSSADPKAARTLSALAAIDLPHKQARFSASQASPRSILGDDDEFLQTSRSASSFSSSDFDTLRTVDDMSPMREQLQRLKMSDERPVRLSGSAERPLPRLTASSERPLSRHSGPDRVSFPSLVPNGTKAPQQDEPPQLAASGRIKTEISPRSFLAMRSAVAAELIALPVAEADPQSLNFRYFELVRQPKSKQRKSYRTENRYLAPNPMTIRYNADGTPHGDAARPRSGGVSVSLVDVLGRPLDVAVQKELAGGARKVLSVGQCTAVTSFSLKMHVTSRGEELRLAFDIDWIGADGVARRERVLSDAFRINTNLRRNDKVSAPKEDDDFDGGDD